jgi:uncharacterized YccA/Bax inhibitor family protein
MTDTNLLLICITALAMVMAILAILGGMIRILTAVFPERSDGPDAAVLAAIHTAAATAYPGRKVTKIEEIR